MKSPNFPCGYCGVSDWALEDGRWVCMQCRVVGRPTPATPNYSNVFDFDTWCDSVLRDYERISDAHVKELNAPVPESPVAMIVQEARLRKLGDDLSSAVALADIATLVKCIRDTNKRGDVYIDLPDVVGDDGYGLKIRVTWP